ncbi:MAG: hypothetical protein ACQETX_11605 [Pseudomonadota bacterium]
MLFQMWDPYRQSLIDGHNFYVEQARKRLLSQFDDIEAEADKAAQEWLERRQHKFDPERHEPSSFHEAATDAGIEFYELLSDMRDRTRLSVVAGMFHEWEKQLRDWLAHEIQHWHFGSGTPARVWSADFGKIADLLESFGWELRSQAYFSELDACRLVVNVYKHGEGPSLEELKQKYPQHLNDPFSGLSDAVSQTRDLEHIHLKVSDEQFQAFSDAIVAFWKDVPENVFDSQITEPPDWFEKAIMNDRAGQRHVSKE